MKTVNGEETVYTYNALNQLVSENDIVYEYDLNGNTVRMTSPDKSALYVYNAENRLIRATVQSGNNVSVEEYKYDYAGNRIAKSSEGEYTKYLLDVNGELTYVLAEIRYDGTEKCYYTRGDELISQERDGKKSYYVYDGHGSVRALANESGVVTDTYSYDAFGDLLKSTGSTKNCYRYCGEQFDETTGLYYLRARYMDTSTGRFISQDTYRGDINDPVSLHKYLYANANPVTYSDPSGYFSEEKFKYYLELYTSTLSIEDRHNKACLEIGIDILEDLAFEQIQAAIQVSLTPFVGPVMAGLFAAGITTALQAAYTLAKSAVTKTITKNDIDDIIKNDRLNVAKDIGDELKKAGVEVEHIGLAGMHDAAKININGNNISSILLEQGNLHGGSYIKFSFGNSLLKDMNGKQLGRMKLVLGTALDYLPGNGDPSIIIALFKNGG